MKLTRTKSGSWAKQVGIGSDFTSIAIFATKGQAMDFIGATDSSLIIRECLAGYKLVHRLGVALGATCYMVGQTKKLKQVMVHASKLECELSNRQPGKCNN